MPWNFQNMQAIFLTEVFGRFRSQKIDVRPSSAFRKLYKIVSVLVSLHLHMD
jgi:hypothetical protein